MGGGDSHMLTPSEPSRFLWLTIVLHVALVFGAPGAFGWKPFSIASNWPVRIQFPSSIPILEHELVLGLWDLRLRRSLPEYTAGFGGFVEEWGMCVLLVLYFFRYDVELERGAMGTYNLMNFMPPLSNAAPLCTSWLEYLLFVWYAFFSGLRVWLKERTHLICSS